MAQSCEGKTFRKEAQMKKVLLILLVVVLLLGVFSLQIETKRSCTGNQGGKELHYTVGLRFNYHVLLPEDSIEITQK
jgi:hypothetical protein